MTALAILALLAGATWLISIGIAMYHRSWLGMDCIPDWSENLVGVSVVAFLGLAFLWASLALIDLIRWMVGG